ncbi:hypothetical protein [Sphingosinicella sp. BN140058]|uniref:hypothetical protein n=1 Tax=Sphingosinicella sp. BN140058 TaxID=1892855 RepID=UPI001010C92D|nr:hypothetical protein [Sphingosinicella sp. BN140058]QAY80139.1 hypothetical protein ETR14_26210 [Sphingosinicella sp. BN140058]
MSKLTGRAKAALLITACVAAAGAAEAKRSKEVSAPPMQSATAEKFVGDNFSMGRPAVRRVRLTGDFFALKPVGGEIPQSIREAKVRIDFAGQQPTFDDLLMLLEERGLSVILGWDDGSYGIDDEGGEIAVSSGSVKPSKSDKSDDGEASQKAEPAGEILAPEPAMTATLGARKAVGAGDLRGRALPFRRYEGTLGGLFRQIQRSMGVTLWWNEGIYVAPVGRYSVMLPQNRDLMNQVVKELKAKGASNVVASLQAGTVSFVAPGALAEEAIRPYLLRLGRNASEVTMQVALVSVTMNENASRGFDWSQFGLTFGRPPSSGAGAGTGTGSGGSVGSGTLLGGTSGTPATGADALPTSGLFSLGQDALRVFNPAATILGATRPLDITGAIKFLSNYGNVAVDQNVEVRTLAGTSVNWRSGETIPYVSGVGATTYGGQSGGFAGAMGSAQTEELETGLSLKLAPNYEAAGGLVTVAFDLELVELIEMVKLDAGNQLGSFTQPRTREQKLDDIVRIPVGETVVLGGLRRQLASVDKNGPFGLYGIGSKTKKNETQTVFIILRPTVTVYEVAGLDQPVPGKSNELTVGNDGEPWAAPEGGYRGTNLFGARVDAAGPDRRRSMAQPEKSYEQ